MSDKLYKKLPALLQTTAIKNFFESTVEQLFSQSEVDQISGYIGRKGSRDFQQANSYLNERTLDRRHYALSPVVNTVNLVTGEPDNLLFYDEIIDLLRSRGVPLQDHNRLFNHNSYHFLPPINVDMFVNFQEYFWVPPRANPVTGAPINQGPSRVVIVSNSDEEAIDLDEDVRGAVSFESASGVRLSNGMVVRFTGDFMEPQSQRDADWIVAGVGEAIRLIEIDRSTVTEAGPAREESPEYLVIERGDTAGSPWSRVNCWYHRDVFTAAGDEVPSRAVQARRPIIEFRYDLELVDSALAWYGSVDLAAPAGITLTSMTNKLEGFQLDTVLLEEGQRVIFPFDPAAQNQIFEVNIDPMTTVISFVVVDTVPENSAVSVKRGFNQIGRDYISTGIGFRQGQRKKSLNQAPLFELYDDEGVSLRDPVKYSNSEFEGSPIWGYAPGTSKPDAVLGFPLLFRPFKNASEIEFRNWLDTDVVYNGKPVPGYYYFKKGNILSSSWIENDRRLQRVTSIYDINTTNSDQTVFDIGATPAQTGAVADIRVLVNGKRFMEWDWLTGSTVVLRQPLNSGDVIEFSVLPNAGINRFSVGRYDLPASLVSNPFRERLSTLSRPEFIEHFKNYLANQIGFEGEPLASNNTRDLILDSSSAERILQTNEDTLLAAYLLDDQQHNLLDAVRFVGTEFAKYRARFRKTLDDMFERMDFSGVTNEAAVEQVLREVISFSVGRGVFDSSYVMPFGDIYSEDRFVVRDETNTRYTTTISQDLSSIKNTVLVYLVQGSAQRLLRIDRDYVIDGDSPVTIVLINPNLGIQLEDTIVVKHYSEDRDSAQCPPTPSAMGLAPIVEPVIEVDDTYRVPLQVIRGHDGSAIPANGDRRDEIFLEFEQRIYNSARTEFRDRNSQLALSEYHIRPGIKRDTGFSLADWSNLLRSAWSSWLTRVDLDATVNEFYDENDPFTWNYSSLGLPGHWRGAYRFYYDTDRPHSHPWECLGFTERPSWWNSEYGAGPWPASSAMWSDIQSGIIRQGARENISDPITSNLYRRPDAPVPVNSIGALLSPNVVLGIPNMPGAPWQFGDGAPVENLWRNSAEYRFAVCEALFLARPGWFATLFGNPVGITSNDIQPSRIISTLTRRAWDWRNPDQFPVHGTTISGEQLATVGYTQFIASWLKFQGLDIARDFEQPLRTLNIRLAHRMAGFVDRDTLTVRTDQYSITGNATSLIVPDENVFVITHISPYKTENTYSGVIVERTNNGYRVRGYDIARNSFTVIESDLQGPREQIVIAGNPEDFLDWRAGTPYESGTLVRYQDRFYRAKSFVSSSSNFTASFWQLLPSVPTVGGISAVYYQQSSQRLRDIPYDTEFSSHEDVFDFLISLGRYHKELGYDFGEYSTEINSVRDWLYSARQFLFWASQGWTTGNTISLSPLAPVAAFQPEFGQVARIASQERSRYNILDQDGRAILPEDAEIRREDNRVEISPPIGREIFGLTLNTREIEHVLVLDNLTEFADTLFDPAVGQKQDRIKVKGSRTGDWDGRLGGRGFIVSGNELLPNLDNLAETMGRYHELGFVPVEKQIYETARSLFGFSERSYLRELDVLDDAQFEFYKGLIQNKGTRRSLTQIARSREVVRGDMTVYDEWALRVGDFGDTMNNQSIELRLEKTDFTQDPQLIKLDFPESITGVVKEIRVTSRKHQYSAPPTILVSGPDTAEGRRATAQAHLNGVGELDQIKVIDGGSGYLDQPGLTVIAGSVIVDRVAEAFVAVPALGSDFVSNVTGLANITIEDHFSSNGAVLIDLSSVTGGNEIANIINADPGLGGNIVATAFASNIDDGNTITVFYTLRLEGADFTLGGDSDTLANLHLVPGRYQPVQRYSVATANNTVAANITVKVNGDTISDSLWSYDPGSTQTVMPSLEIATGSATVVFPSAVSAENTLRVDGVYPHLALFVNGIEVVNPGYETRWEMANTTSVFVPDVSLLPTGAITVSDEFVLIEKSTVAFGPSYQDDLPGASLEILVETNDGIAVILGTKRTFEVTPDIQGDGITLIDIDDTDRFLKKPSGMRTKALWPTLSEVNFTGVVDARYLNIPNSGYVKPDTIPYRAFDVPSMSNLWDSDLLYRPGKGDLIHVAKAENLKWNVYQLEEIEANVSYVRQRGNDATAYLLTDSNLEDYLDGNRVGEIGTERFLDFYLALKGTSVSDNLVIWTNKQQVDSESGKVTGLTSGLFEMTEAAIAEIRPAANSIIAITDLRPEVSAFIPADAEPVGNNTVLISAVTGNLRNGDTVVFYDQQDLSNLSANVYTVSNVTLAGFTVEDANVTSPVDSANLTYGYMGRTQLTANGHGLYSGELVRVAAEGYNGYYFVESADANTIVIDAPYITGGATSGNLLLPGVEIVTVEPHGIPVEYAGKRIAVHLADPRYYNQVFTVTGVGANTIALANDFAYDLNTHIQTNAIVTTIDHNKIVINGHAFYLDNTNSARGITNAFNRSVELRRGFIQDAGSLNLGFPMLKTTKDPLTGVTGNQVAGNIPYLLDLHGLDRRNYADVGLMTIIPAVERQYGFIDDRDSLNIRNINNEQISTPSRVNNTTNVAPESPVPINRTPLPSWTNAAPSPAVSIPKITPLTPGKTAPAIASNTGAPVINPSPATALPAIDKCATKPPIPPKKPAVDVAEQAPASGTNSSWMHSSLDAGTSTQRYIAANTPNGMRLVFNGFATGIRITVYQGTVAGSENTLVINTASARPASRDERAASALGASLFPDFQSMPDNFARHIGVLAWTHNPARGNFYRIVLEKHSSGRLGAYEICYTGIQYNPEPRAQVIAPSSGPTPTLTPPSPRPAPKPTPPPLPLPAIEDARQPVSPIVTPVGTPVNTFKNVNYSIWGLEDVDVAVASRFAANFGGYSLPPMTGINIVPDALKSTVQVSTNGGRFVPVDSGNVVSDNLQRVSGGVEIPFTKSLGALRDNQASCQILIGSSADLQNETWSQVYGVTRDAFRGTVEIEPRLISGLFNGYFDSTLRLDTLSALALQSRQFRIEPTATSEPTNIVGCPVRPPVEQVLTAVSAKDSPVKPNIEFTSTPVIKIQPKIKEDNQYKPAGNPAYARIEKPTPSVKISLSDADGVRGGDELIINGTKIVLPSDPSGVLSAIRDSAGDGYKVKSSSKDGEPAITISSCTTAPITVRDGCRGGTYLEVLDFHVNTLGLSTETSNTSIATPSIANVSVSYTHFDIDGDTIGMSNTTATTGSVYSSRSVQRRGLGYSEGDRLRVVGGVPVPDPFGSIKAFKIVNPGSGYSSPENLRVFVGDGTTAGNGASAGRIELDDTGGILAIQLASPGEGYDATNLPSVRVVDLADNGSVRPAIVTAVFDSTSERPERVAKFVVTSVDAEGRIIDLRVTDRGIYKQFPSDLVEGVPLEYDRVLDGDAGPGASGLGVANPGSGGAGARVFLTAREIPDCSERGDARRTLGLPSEVRDINIPASLADDLNNALLLSGYLPEDIAFDAEDINRDIGMLTLNSPAYDGIELDEETPGFLIKLGIPTGDYNLDTIPLGAELETSDIDENPALAGPGDFVDDDGFAITQTQPVETVSFVGANTIDLSALNRNTNSPLTANANVNVSFTTSLFQYELRTPGGEPVSLGQSSQNAQVLYFESRRRRDSSDLPANGQVWVDNYNNNGWAYLVDGVVTAQQEPLVDTLKIRNAIVYDEDTGARTLDLQVWDPFKGILPGYIRREIQFVSEIDPVAYRSARSNFGSKDVGKVWWDTSTVAYQWYEQGTPRQRAANWGKAFPGSRIALYEWTESRIVPAQYPGPGTPRNTTAFVTERRFNPITNGYENFYYFWVNNSSVLTVDAQKQGRQLDVLTLSRLMSSPRNQGVATIGYSGADSFVLSNVAKALRDDDDILQINFRRGDSDLSINHSAFKLLREGDRRSGIPEDLSLKLIDSLSGENAIGQPVPDPLLSRIESLGVQFRPRQTMFKNLATARRLMVETVNSSLANVRFSARFSGWQKLIPANSPYVTLRTWYAVRDPDTGERYDSTYKPVYRVNSAGELRALGRIPDGSIAQVKASRNDDAQLWIYRAAVNQFELIGAERDTVAFTDQTWQAVQSSELASDIRALLTLVKELLGEDTAVWNEFFFEMIKHAFAEQGELSWAFKTSFLYVEKEEEDLIEFSGFRADNFENVLAYLNEAKSYSAKVREYRDGKRAPLELLGTNSLSDYDKPPYPDPARGVRILGLENDSSILSTDPAYVDWYSAITNRNLVVETSQGWDTVNWDTGLFDGRSLISFFESEENPIRTVTSKIRYDRTGWIPLSINYDAGNTALVQGVANRLAQLNSILNNSLLWPAAELRAVDRVFMFTPAVRHMFDYEIERFAGTDESLKTDAAVIGTAITEGALAGTLALMKTLAQGDFRGTELDGGLFTQNTDQFDSLEVYNALGFDSDPWDGDGFDLATAIDSYIGTFGDTSTLLDGDEVVSGFDAVTFKRLFGEERPEELALFEPLESLSIRVTTLPTTISTIAFSENFESGTSSFSAGSSNLFTVTTDPAQAAIGSNRLAASVGTSLQRAWNPEFVWTNTDGGTLSGYVRIEGSGTTIAGLGWGQSTGLNGYSVRIDSQSGTGSQAGFQLRINNSDTVLDSDDVIVVNQDVWYRIEVDWKDSGTRITTRLYDLAGTLLSTLTSTNSAITSGFIGVEAIQVSSFDDIMLDLTPPVSVSGNAQPVEFIWHYDQAGNTDLYRVLPDTETTLAAPLAAWSDTVTVANASVLVQPDENTDGYVWVGSEKIGYKLIVGNQLRQLMRGAGGTTIESHAAGARVVSASNRDNARTNNIEYNFGSWLVPGTNQVSITQLDQTNNSPQGKLQRFLRGQP
jgi:hypothetical protein